jgi:hypothetical protein
MKNSSHCLSASLLVAACLATTLPATARAGFEKLQGQYRGNYLAVAIFPDTTQNAHGPSRAMLKSLASGRRGRLNLSGANQNTPSGRYTAEIEFHAGGICSTNAMLPALFAQPATGRWTANPTGRIVKFTLIGSSPFGSFSSKGTLSGAGKSLKLRIVFVGSNMSQLVPKSGTYVYNGRR